MPIESEHYFNIALFRNTNQLVIIISGINEEDYSENIYNIF